MGNGNFKVRCIDTADYSFYTKGKVYEITDGKLIADDGDQAFDGLNTINDLQEQSGATWELVKEYSGEYISIKRRKKRVVAVMSVDGQYKKSANVKLNDFDGDFEKAAKAVVGKLLENKEDAPLTASTIDWEAFKRGEFAVHCDTEEKAEAFLKECDEQGIKWADGKSLLIENKWKDHKTETLYGFDGGVGLYYGTARGFDYKPSIDYTPSKPAIKEVKRPAKVGEWIRVTDAGGHDNGTGVFMVTRLAKCSNGWVYVNGRDIGVIRGDQYVVLENYQPEQSSIDSNPEPEEPTSSTAMREVERLAQAGEIVKIVNAFSVPVTNGEDEYSNGDILKIIEGGYQVRYAEGSSDDGRNRVLNQSEYVVLENYDYSLGHPKNEPFRKAKVGDKVRIIKGNGKGKEFYIRQVGFDYVEPKGYDRLYDTDQNYIIIEEVPEEIQIGDTVKVVNYGHTCDTYRDFIKKYAKGFYHKYAHGYTPNNGDIGVVVGKGKHERYINKDYYTVLANDKVFCISEEGIEKVK